MRELSLLIFIVLSVMVEAFALSLGVSFIFQGFQLPHQIPYTSCFTALFLWNMLSGRLTSTIFGVLQASFLTQEQFDIMILRFMVTPAVATLFMLALDLILR